MKSTKDEIAQAIWDTVTQIALSNDKLREKVESQSKVIEAQNALIAELKENSELLRKTVEKQKEVIAKYR